MDLAQEFADAREEAAVLRRNSASMSPDRLEQLLNNFERAAEDYLRFDAEGDARLYSGKSVEWLRARFTEWELQGHAKKVGHVRYYRRLVLPRRGAPRCTTGGSVPCLVRAADRSRSPDSA